MSPLRPSVAQGHPVAPKPKRPIEAPLRRRDRSLEVEQGRYPLGISHLSAHSAGRLWGYL